MLDRFIHFIRSKSREEWLQLIRERWNNLRIWIQEHGELAAVAGFLLGIVIVLFFKVVVFVAVVVFIFLSLGWNIARSGSQNPAGTQHPSGAEKPAYQPESASKLE